MDEAFVKETMKEIEISLEIEIERLRNKFTVRKIKESMQNKDIGVSHFVER